MSKLSWISIALFAFALVAGVGFWLQRTTTAALQSELALARDEHRALAQRGVEHERLIAAQPATAELERLRADRAALIRLRSEIEQLQARAEQMRRADQSASDAPYVLAPRAPRLPPKLSLNIKVGSEGKVMFEGGPLDLDLLKRQFGALARGDGVEIRLQLADKSISDVTKRSLNEIAGVAKELGLKLNVRIDGL